MATSGAQSSKLTPQTTMSDAGSATEPLVDRPPSLRCIPHMRVADVACARTYAELCITFHDSASTFTSLRQLLRNLLRRRIEPAEYERP